MDQEKVWDKIAPLWHEHKTESFGDKDNLVEKFVEDNDKVLDLGCGSGRNFINKGEWYGVDFSKEMLKFARKKNYIELKKANVWDTEFKSEFFDKIICITTLHCIESKEKRQKTFGEIYRILKPKGKLIITVWNKNSKRWKNKPKEKFVGWNLNDTHEEKVLRYYYLYDFDELKNELENAGFKIFKHNNIDARNLVLIVEK